MVSTCKITSDIPQALTFTVASNDGTPTAPVINKLRNGGLALVLTPWKRMPALFSKLYPEKNELGKETILRPVSFPVVLAKPLTTGRKQLFGTNKCGILTCYSIQKNTIIITI